MQLRMTSQTEPVCVEKNERLRHFRGGGVFYGNGVTPGIRFNDLDNLLLARLLCRW